MSLSQQKQNLFIHFVKVLYNIIPCDLENIFNCTTIVFNVRKNIINNFFKFLQRDKTYNKMHFLNILCNVVAMFLKRFLNGVFFMTNVYGYFLDPTK